jgi:RNA polymerase sigma-70 factor, ECF subfamily
LSRKKIIIPEEELVRLVQDKDQRAFSILYDNYSAALYGVILKIVRIEETASDVTQDAFVKIWRNIETYNRTKGSLFTWMLNVARNTAIDKLRSQEYQQSARNQSIDDVIGLVDNEYDTQQYTDYIGLRKIVESLKPEHRQLVDLLYFQGYTQNEVAEEFGIPLGTVKTRIKAAITQLRSSMGGGLSVGLLIALIVKIFN